MKLEEAVRDVTLFFRRNLGGQTPAFYVPWSPEWRLHEAYERSSLTGSPQCLGSISEMQMMKEVLVNIKMVNDV